MADPTSLYAAERLLATLSAGRSAILHLAATHLTYPQLQRVASAAQDDSRQMLELQLIVDRRLDVLRGRLRRPPAEERVDDPATPVDANGAVVPATKQPAAVSGAKAVAKPPPPPPPAKPTLNLAAELEPRATQARVAEAKVAEAKVAEAKVAEAKVAEAKAAEAKAAEAKAAEAKAAEAKAAEAAAAEAKAAEAAAAVAAAAAAAGVLAAGAAAVGEPEEATVADLNPPQGGDEEAILEDEPAELAPVVQRAPPSSVDDAPPAPADEPPESDSPTSISPEDGAAPAAPAGPSRLQRALGQAGLLKSGGPAPAAPSRSPFSEHRQNRRGATLAPAEGDALPPLETAGEAEQPAAKLAVPRAVGPSLRAPDDEDEDSGVAAVRAVAPIGVRVAGTEDALASDDDLDNEMDGIGEAAPGGGIRLGGVGRTKSPPNKDRGSEAPRLTDEEEPSYSVTATSSPQLRPAGDDVRVEKLLEEAAASAGRGDLAKAIQSYSDVLDLRFDRGEAHIGRGRCHLELGDYSAAMSDFQRAEDLQPDRPDAHVAMGDLYFARKEYRRAIEFYDQAVELDGSHAMARCRRGISHYYRKNYRQAFQDLQRAYSLDPEIPNIRKYVQMAVKKMERGD